MAQYELTVTKREKSGTSNAKRLRHAGSVPCVVYHKGDASIGVQLPKRVLFNALHTDAGRNVLIDLKIENDKSRKKRTVVVKDLQHHPVSGDITHVDFHQISLTEKITVHVKVVEKGEAPGIKNDGGVLDFPMREIEVECLPTDIPEHFTVDISGLGMNDAIHVRDLTIPANVTLKSDPESVVIHVAPPKIEEPEPVEGEEKAEPEVIGEKKEGDEEAPEAAKTDAPAKETKSEGGDKK